MEGMKRGRKEKRKRSLYMVFIRYLVRFCAATLLLVCAVLLLYTVSVNTGMVRLPTYERSRLNEQEEAIRKSEGNEAALIPDSCLFGVYDKEGNFLYGTFEGKERENAWEITRDDGYTGRFYNTFYMEIPKDDGNVVVVRFQYVAKFSDPGLRRLFPNAEFLFLAILLTLFLLQAVWTARSFGRYLKKRLDTLTVIADKVGREDLNFSREHSDIREVDDVLSSLFVMKEALQKSLKEQWRAAQQKEEQAAALAHDIKTPLTIIRGNAELMQETDSLEEIREWDREILENAAEMERYLEILRKTLGAGRIPQELRGEISGAGKNSPEGEEKRSDTEISSEDHQEETFEVSRFLREIRQKAEALGRTRRLKVECLFEEDGKEAFKKETGKPAGFAVRGRKGIRRDLERAVGNVLSNAVDYCPEGWQLTIRAELIRGENTGRETVLPDTENVVRETVGSGEEIVREVAGTGEEIVRETAGTGMEPIPETGTGELFWRITVTDSGPGFSREALAHGTERFFQGDKSRRGKEHYGLGLSIANTVLEEIGGRLTLGNSRRAGGGEVRMEIPVREGRG